MSDENSRLLQAVVKEIRAAVKECFEAGKEARVKETEECHKRTEMMLYSFPILKKKQDDLTTDLINLSKGELSGRARDIVVHKINNTRLQKDDVIEALAESVKFKLVRNSRMLDEIEAGLDIIRDDDYYEIIPLKYFEKPLPDDAIAERIRCSERTVRYQKNRLVDMLSVAFFGADAVR